MRAYISKRCINYMNNEVFAGVHIFHFSNQSQKYIGYLLGIFSVLFYFSFRSLSLFLFFASFGNAFEWKRGNIQIWYEKRINFHVNLSGAQISLKNIICDNLITVCNWSLYDYYFCHSHYLDLKTSEMLSSTWITYKIVNFLESDFCERRQCVCLYSSAFFFSSLHTFRFFFVAI